MNFTNHITQEEVETKAPVYDVGRLYICYEEKVVDTRQAIGKWYPLALLLFLLL
jgi:hypothetical protein